MMKNQKIYLMTLLIAAVFATYSCSDDDCTEVTWYQDADADGFGDASNTLTDCDQPEGYVSNSTDCDDTNADVNPDATEVVDNGIDDDCDGEIDES